MSTKEKHLYYLSELKDYKVNSKDADIRGWSVKDLDNRVIGKVDNLLVNKELGKVVYVDVEVDQAIIDTRHDPYSATPGSKIKEFINKDGENHIIVPIGLIDLNLDDKYVYTESIDYQTFAETKRYQSGTHISRDYERHVLGSYDRRRGHPDNDRELRRTSSAYSDAELAERERLREQEALRREDSTHPREPESDLEAKIRREKENLRYNSGDRKSGIKSENKEYHKTDNLNPNRTLDEDSDWELDEPGVMNETSYERRRRRKNYDDDFYDREEFRDRDHL